MYIKVYKTLNYVYCALVFMFALMPVICKYRSKGVSRMYKSILRHWV